MDKANLLWTLHVFWKIQTHYKQKYSVFTTQFQFWPSVQFLVVFKTWNSGALIDFNTGGSSRNKKKENNSLKIKISFSSIRYLLNLVSFFFYWKLFVVLPLFVYEVHASILLHEKLCYVVVKVLFIFF